MVQLNQRWAPHWLQETPLFMINAYLTLPLHTPSLYSLSTLGYCNGTAHLQLGSTPHQSQHDPPPFVINTFDTPHLPS